MISKKGPSVGQASELPDSSDVNDKSAESQPPTYDLTKFPDVLSLFRDNDEQTVVQIIRDHIASLLQKHGLEKYHLILLFDEQDPISSYHANQVYAAATVAEKQDILLFLHSSGGSIEPAYLIAKTCKRLAHNRFVVAVPRRAKSAGTLIALGADEIHMGLMSELGPVDPQLGGYPALALANAFDVLAELACRFPDSAEMFAKYLTANLDLKDVGYSKRVGESAEQYAERLLTGKKLPEGQTAESLADHFVNHYKDHGFVIDIDETASLLGADIVRQNTKEYAAANELFKLFDFCSFLSRVLLKKSFEYVGAVGGGPTLRELRER